MIYPENSDTSFPRCSIIVPSYYSARTIIACLTALTQQDMALPYEIIVVDSGPDDTAALVRQHFPGVRLIALARRTYPEEARNIGAQRALGEILAFIDSDCIAPRDWLRRLTAHLEDGYDCIGGATANAERANLVSWAGYMCEFREFLPVGDLREVHYLSPNTVAYRRETFWQAGGFTPGFYPMEDQVFHHPLRERGARIGFDPRIMVDHVHRSTQERFIAHQRRIGRANARIMRRLELPGKVLVEIPALALIALPALVLYRFARTLYACRSVAGGLVLRSPALAWLCWLGMCEWGLGFVAEAFNPTSLDDQESKLEVEEELTRNTASHLPTETA